MQHQQVQLQQHFYHGQHLQTNGYYLYSINNTQASLRISTQTIGPTINNGYVTVDFRFYGTTAFEKLKDKNVSKSCIRHPDHPIHNWIKKCIVKKR